MQADEKWAFNARDELDAKWNKQQPRKLSTIYMFSVEHMIFMVTATISGYVFHVNSSKVGRIKYDGRSGEYRADSTSKAGEPAEP